MSMTTEHPAREWARERGKRPFNKAHIWLWAPGIPNEPFYPWDIGDILFECLPRKATGSEAEAWSDLEVAYDSILVMLGLRGEVEAAVKEERERCAKLVETWDCSCAMTCQCYRTAAAIRNLPTAPARPAAE